MTVQPYLIFNGRSEEAIRFYEKAIGATQTALMRFRDAPPMPAGSEPPEGCAGGPPPDLDKVMHASFRVGTTEIMCSDGMPGEDGTFNGFSLALSASDPAQAKQYFDGLAEGGSVQVPLAPTFFSPCFGIIVDRFGVSWMVVVAPASPPS